MTYQQKNENMAEVYVVHISIKNSLSSVINSNFVRIAEKCGAVFAVNCIGADPERHAATFILPDRKHQKRFARELKRIGIAFESCKKPAYVNRESIECILLPEWEELKIQER